MEREQLVNFIVESNKIEGIFDGPTYGQVEVAQDFLILDKITVNDLNKYVSVMQPNAELREHTGLNVYVGNHSPLPGGPVIRSVLEDILDDANNLQHPFWIHHRYESLHPYTDCNGRSGRMLWAWGMRQKGLSWGRIGFLHTWYYQSLEFTSRNPS